MALIGERIKIVKFSKVHGSILLNSQYRRFHVYQHVTSFSHMRSALVGKRTTATSFHRQNTGNVFANTLEYWSKYTNILNPTLREDRPVEVWQIVRSVLGLKKRQDELSRSVVCWQTPQRTGTGRRRSVIQPLLLLITWNNKSVTNRQSDMEAYKSLTRPIVW